MPLHQPIEYPLMGVNFPLIISARSAGLTIELCCPLPPSQKGGGVWLRTRTGYGAAWRPHLLEKPRPLTPSQKGGGVEGSCMVAHKKKK